MQQNFDRYKFSISPFFTPKQKSFTLIEIIVGMALMLLVFIGLYGAFQFGMKVVGQSKARVTALAIANRKMEEIRNLPYKDIGTVGGIPPGVVSETEDLAQNSVNFTVKTTIVYVDDPFDGLAPTDTLPADYKRAKIKVSWSGFFSGEITSITDIAPKGIETTAGGGTLKISVFDASGIGVPQATLHVVNTKVSPNIDASYQTDDTGNFVLAGAPTSTEGYQITATKSGFNEDRTYSKSEVANPSKPPASVFEGQVTEISFSIDRLSDFSIETRGRESFDDDFNDQSKIAESSDITVENSQVTLKQVSSSTYATSGSLTSVSISPLNLLNWDRLVWSDEQPSATNIKYQLLFATGTSFELIPDSDLSGNTQGFEVSPVDISGLDINKYKKLRIKATLSTNSTSTTPTIFDWHLTYNTPLLADVDFHLQGEKIIGTDANGTPVYKYSETTSSDANGKLTISSLEWDSYTFSAVTSTGMDLSETIPAPQPINLLPGTTTAVILYFKAENTLLVTVEDASTSQPIFGANVRVYTDDLSYDNSEPTDTNGEAYFLPLESGTYNLAVWSNNYQSASTTVAVSGDTLKLVKLFPK